MRPAIQRLVGLGDEAVALAVGADRRDGAEELGRDAERRAASAVRGGPQRVHQRDEAARAEDGHSHGRGEGWDEPRLEDRANDRRNDDGELRLNGQLQHLAGHVSRAARSNALYRVVERRDVAAESDEDATDQRLVVKGQGRAQDVAKRAVVDAPA